MATSPPSLATLIARARDATAPTADRHQAFAEIVRRFEDLAIACASARLRDRALAEDATQDAFVVAWQRLDQLRDPSAFPGWIRRLVLTQCHRRLRCARLTLVPHEDAPAVAASDAAMEQKIDAEHDSAIVRLSLAKLAPADRLVLSLFYGSERSHKEIAAWLGVPATTVARRLAHAKRRLQKHAIDVLSGALRADRQATRRTFAVELSARLRRADATDADAIVMLGAQSGARNPLPALRAPVSAYVVEDPASGAPVAYAAAMPTIFAPIYDLHVAIGPDAVRCHAGDVLLMQIVEDLQQRNAVSLQHRAAAPQRELVDFLQSRGFTIVRRSQDWRLDARSPDWRARARAVSTRSFEFRSLADVAESPALFDGALQLIGNALAEDSAAWPYLPIHPDAFRRVLRMQRAGAIALAGGTIQGLIGGSNDDLVPDACRINLLVVAPRRRRKGLATALLHKLLRVNRPPMARVVTSSCGGVPEWLARRGFVQAPDALLLERLLRATVRVAPERLDDYVGTYVVQDRQLPPIVIERHGEALVSTSRDMRDLLLASSESTFFTRHHHGCGRFERDAIGRVTRLVVTEPPHTFVAVRQADVSREVCSRSSNSARVRAGE